MGWVVWLLVTSVCAVASYLVAIATFPDRGTLDRAITALVVMPGLLMLDIEVCGLTGHFAPWPLACVGLVAFGGVALSSLRRAGVASVRVALATDVRAPVRLAVDAWRTREIAVFTVPVVAAALLVLSRMVWYFKSWTWDPVWYHVPITSYAVQEQSTGWIETSNVFAQGYPRNIELLAAWNCVFPRDNRLDDSAQLPFALLGMAVVAAWTRRVGATRGLAAGLAAAWFLLPPMFLQAHSTHVDLACGALFSAAFYFLSDENTPRSRYLCLLAMGLYLGTKFAGGFHLALIAPILAVRAIVELKRAGPRCPRALGSIGLSIALLLSVGIYHYVENYLHTENPLWPFVLKLPFVAQPLPGPVELGMTLGDPPGVAPYFWGAPGAFRRMLESWFDTRPFYAPDVRSGGFGPLFRWLLLPAVLVVAADVVRGRELRRGLPVLALFVMALAVPAAWWTRFTTGAGTAAVVALAIVHGQLPRRGLKLLLSGALVALTAISYRAAYAGFITYPKHFEAARAADPDTRAALQLDTFLWPTEAGLLRERELAAGDVVAYDESTVFLAEFFTRDYRTKVVFVSSAGDPHAYVARLRALNARWVGVARGSDAARAVQAAGGEWLFAAPTSDVDVWRMPRPPHWP